MDRMNHHRNMINEHVSIINPVPYTRYDSTSGGEREIQRTMLELLNQLDGFDSRGDVKVKYERGKDKTFLAMKFTAHITSQEHAV